MTQVDIYDGEHYNASMETPGWTSGGYTGAAGSWVAAVEVPPPSGHVKVTSHAVLPPIRVRRGTAFLLDFHCHRSFSKAVP